MTLHVYTFVFTLLASRVCLCKFAFTRLIYTLDLKRSNSHVSHYTFDFTRLIWDVKMKCLKYKSHILLQCTDGSVKLIQSQTCNHTSLTQLKKYLRITIWGYLRWFRSQPVCTYLPTWYLPTYLGVTTPREL